MSAELSPLPALNKNGHVAHCNRCLAGLPSSLVEMDSSRMAFSFYCLGTLDLMGVADTKISEVERKDWTEWIWAQQARGEHGTGFRPSPFVTTEDPSLSSSSSKPSGSGSPSYTIPTYTVHTPPNLIMTYAALQSLAILRDSFDQLDRDGLVRFLRACQDADGGFSTTPGCRDSDLRMVYCAFAISSMLGDWRGVDVPRALEFIWRCRTYEGGYGQAPFCEAQGGTTYCALACLYLAPSSSSSSSHPDVSSSSHTPSSTSTFSQDPSSSSLPPPPPPSPPSPLSPSEHASTLRWLVHTQDAASGGFVGRTGKLADACYCFWCGAGIEILGHGDVVDRDALAGFMGRCQYKFGGIAKAPGEHPDPYHTYLSCAMIAMYPPQNQNQASPLIDPSSKSRPMDEKREGWAIAGLDPLLNARRETAGWAREKIGGSGPAV
ncbi:terpenoid cyclases/Protein prenyltransferase [Stereum hirsutum FP-91666 SS1]|uniref:terpenoid cyclases/Protein prenyltransferase n=1 Tax=Stereum hirsutum (strain FP-91666) TaxID=721885 RepID=UPI0004449B67|nr:terpenoid cyclases/Protein prenyltransferase [Stereum hirsutum FP-91666 SS1]EIM86136.1 terpenoid cyclases/Protein prenyltransferase [Stereum hirsutum FP-91666 SS1]